MKKPSKKDSVRTSSRRRNWSRPVALAVALPLAAVACGPGKGNAGDMVRGRVERPIPEGVAPDGVIAVPAAWEPALGAFVSWPLKVPEELVVEIASDDRLFMLAQPEEIDDAREKLLALGISEASFEIIPAPVESPYPRDFGPHQIFDADGTLAVLDAVFAGWPRYPASWGEAGPGEPPYTWYAGDGDDDVSLAVAEHFTLRAYRLPAYLTGGNFLVDGEGTAFVTEAQIDENHTDARITSDFFSLVREYAGIEKVHVLKNTEELGIQHIDTWLKPLDTERLLVARPPAGHPMEARINASLELLAAATNSFGRPYQILRIDAGEVLDWDEEDDEDLEIDEDLAAELAEMWSDETGVAPYTNALILNHKILVPLFGIDTDDAALATWREVMPGYEVVGFPHDDWYSFDALHCRTRALFDAGMLRISGMQLRQGEPEFPEPRVTAIIRAMSGAQLIGDSLVVVHRAVGEPDWRETPMIPGELPNEFHASLGDYSAGAEVEIEFYVSAADESGRAETSPRSGAAGPARRFVTTDR
jgi:agmatine deiminase